MLRDPYLSSATKATIPFFLHEFEIEHWKEMKAKLLLSITL